MHSSTTRRTPLILSASAGLTTESPKGGSLRFPLEFSPSITRWRLHVSNRNDRFDQGHDAQADVTGAWLGVGDPANGEYWHAPRRVLDPFRIPGGGEPWVSPWVDLEIGAGVSRLLSFGWSAREGAVHRSTAGCFRSDALDGASAVPGSSFQRATGAPFSWWIEAETARDVPAVGMWGDSLTCGVGNDLPVHESPLSLYCRAAGALPVHYAYPGTGMKLWTHSDAYVWRRWAGLDRPDRVVHFMGRNDIVPGISREELARRYTATIDNLKAHVSQDVHVASLTARSRDTTDERLARFSHNAWLRTLPGGAAGFLDFAGAVRSEGDPGALRPEFAADSVHFTSRGSEALAAVLSSGLPDPIRPSPQMTSSLRRV